MTSGCCRWNAVPLRRRSTKSSTSATKRQHSTIVTTNRGLPDWGEIFGDAVVASAILDRLMHNAVVFNIKGPSWRLREHQALTTASHRPDQTTTPPLTSPTGKNSNPRQRDFR